MNMGALLIIGKKVNLGNLAGKRVRCTGQTMILACELL